MSTTIDSLDIQISTTLKKSDKALDNLIEKLNTVQASLSSIGGKSLISFNGGLNKTNSVISKTAKSTKSLATAFGKFYASYFLVVRGIKTLYNSIEKTADYIEAFNYYNVAFGKIASEWSGDWEKYGYENAEAYSDSFVQRMNETLGKLSGVQVKIGEDGKGLLTETGFKNLGLNIKEVTQYASQLASVSDSVGMTAESSLALARTMTMLAGDVSSLFNVDYSSVATNIQAVLQGQSRAGYKYGWDTTLATLQKYADELNLSKPVSEMTQLEKRYLRVLAVLDQSKVSWGDLANTIASPSNMLRQLTNNLEEAGMILGQLFIPVLEKVLPVLNGVTIAIKRLLVNIAGFLGVEIDFSSFGQGYSDTENSLEGIADGYNAVADAANKAAKGTRKFDELNVISLGNASEKNNASGAVGTIDLTDEILKATAEYEKVWNEAYSKMENRAAEFADKIYTTLTGDDWSIIGKEIAGGITEFINVVSNWINNIEWEKIGSQIQTFFDGIPIGEITFSIGELAIDLGKALFKIWWGGKQAIYEKYGIMGVILDAIAGIIPGGKLAYKIAAEIGLEIAERTGVKEWFENNISKPFSEKLEEVKNNFSEKWNNISENAINAWEKIKETASGIAEWFNEKVITPVVNFFTPIKETISDVFEGAWIVTKAVWQEATKWFEKLTEPIRVAFSTMGTIISDKLTDAWNKIKEVWGFASDWINNQVVKPIGKVFEKLWSGLKNGVVNAMNGIIGTIENMLNFFIDGVNGVLKGFNKVVTWAADIIGEDWGGITLLSEVNLPTIQVRANGGYIEDGIFTMNYGEMAGKFNNGKSIVANNQQITQGIANAVYPAVKNAMSEVMSRFGNQPIRVYVGDRELTEIVVDGINERTKVNQKTPLLIY